MALPAIVGDTGVWLDETSVDAMLARIERALSPESIGAFMEGEVRPYWWSEAHRHFGTQGTNTDAWAPLAEMTQREREHQGFDPEYPINVRTGALEAYLTKDEGRIESLGTNATQWSYPNTTDTLTAEKYRTAQQGDHATGAPAREIVEADEQSLADITVLLETYLEEQFAAETLGGIFGI